MRGRHLIKFWNPPIEFVRIFILSRIIIHLIFGLIFFRIGSKLMIAYISIIFFEIIELEEFSLKNVKIILHATLSIFLESLLRSDVRLLIPRALIAYVRVLVLADVR